ncbi:hypothetical protein [Streptomyces flaveolus]|uniref:hypothetical protein n=1 Tax=Streptomyces flaveolus TaxID=67297 RepID=UPI0038043A6F
MEGEQGGDGVDADAEVDGRVAADALVGVEGGEDGAQRGCGVDVVGALQAALGQCGAQLGGRDVAEVADAGAGGGGEAGEDGQGEAQLVAHGRRRAGQAAGR